MADKFWMGSAITTCDICSQPITTTFIDGKTRMGPWANMCPTCHARVGVGLGLGRGQQYEKQPDGKFKKGRWLNHWEAAQCRLPNAAGLHGVTAHKGALTRLPFFFTQTKRYQQWTSELYWLPAILKADSLAHCAQQANSDAYEHWVDAYLMLTGACNLNEDEARDVLDSEWGAFAAQYQLDGNLLGRAVSGVRLRQFQQAVEEVRAVHKRLELYRATYAALVRLWNSAKPTDYRTLGYLMDRTAELCAKECRYDLASAMHIVGEQE